MVNIQLELVANHSSSQSVTANIFSRQALLDIRDNVPCVLKRAVRKTLFRLKIWDIHDAIYDHRVVLVRHLQLQFI